jgi:hypothetical protein
MVCEDTLASLKEKKDIQYLEPWKACVIFAVEQLGTV